MAQMSLISYLEIKIVSSSEAAFFFILRAQDKIQGKWRGLFK